ncbi:hypothetical protein [Marinobacter sp.]|uniref:hypothetical protein n=1 Tax=Marinobacter sp. TaxID=50741 RepID=UPI003563A38A
MPRFCSLALFLLILPAQALPAGIPIIDAAKVQQMIQDEIKKRVNDLRQEALDRLQQTTGIDIRKSEESNDENIAANTATRITDTVSEIHNNKADSQVAPFLDACSNVSIARTSNSTANNSEIQRDLPNRVAAYVRPDRNPRFLAETLAFANYRGTDFGTERQRILNDLRNYERERLQVLDDAIINVAQEPGGFTLAYEAAVTNRVTKERVDFLRQMLIGNGVSPSFKHGAISPANSDVRQKQMVEEGLYQTERSASLVGTTINNDQTAITQDNILPIEAAIDAAADPELQERLNVEMTNNPRMMVDRVMLQRWALSKAVRLAALLQEYKRGQVELLQLSTLVKDRVLE